jgi:hypothetical protein
MFKKKIDIGISYTLTCPLTCQHCITNSSPKAKGKMSLEKAKAYLKIISKYDNSICFTGGEPLLFHTEILELIHYAKQLGFQQVHIVSGAGWVGGEPDTRRKIKELVEAGLKVMAISWDPYHEGVGSQDRVRTLAKVATEYGLFVIIRSALPVGSNPDAQKIAFEGIPVHFASFPLVRLGRAKTLPLEHFQQYDTFPTGPCGTVLSIVVEYDGQVYACCGPSKFSQPHSPLVLGNAEHESLDIILDRAINDPILDVISLLGPYGLYLLLKQSEGQGIYTPRKNYTSICDLCLDLTDSPQIISAIREQIKEHDAQVLIESARMWMKEKLWPRKYEQYEKQYGKSVIRQLWADDSTMS